MRSLVVDTATAACSVALIDDGAIVAEAHDLVGRGHAERLLPMIAGLPGGGRADALLVDVGPGSFTGIRVGLAAARALALGWGVPLAGYSAMALLAAARFAEDDAPLGLAVALEGGHGELFVQCFTAPLAEATPLASLPPDAALAAIGSRPVIGSGARWLAPLAPEHALSERWPRAADARLLPRAFASLAPRPLYGRPPDAKPMAAA